MTRTRGGWILAAGLVVLGPAACGDAVQSPTRDLSGGGEGTAARAEARASDSVRVQQQIEAMLGSSASSWNAGDLDGFLDDYSDAGELTFVGEGGVLRGLDAVRSRYESSYWREGASRDSLRFDSLEVRPLGTGHALALGRYVLYRPSEGGAVTASGPFSLVLRKDDDGTWKIVHDHSS